MMTALVPDPAVLDIVARDGLYAVYTDGQPLLTPGGHAVAHGQVRFVDYIVRSLWLRTASPAPLLDAYTLFVFQKDVIEPGAEPVFQDWALRVESDPVACREREKCVFDASSSAAPGAADLGGADLTVLWQGAATLARALNQALMQRGQVPWALLSQTPDRWAPVFRALFDGLKPEQKAAVLGLSALHGSGLMLPILLVERVLLPSEYAAGLFSVRPAGSRPAPALACVPALWAKLPGWDQAPARCVQLTRQAAELLEYCALAEGAEEKSQVRDVIRKGEGYDVEFKSTLRWNLKASKKDPDIEHASLKTLSAFLNSSGGTLLIGVRDDGTIEGIETDQFPNEDRFALHFWNLVKSSMGHDVSAHVKAEFEKVEGRTVLAVHCAPSPSPVFLKQSGFDEEFYIRVGPASARLSIQEALAYIAHRFGKCGNIGVIVLPKRARAP